MLDIGKLIGPEITKIETLSGCKLTEFENPPAKLLYALAFVFARREDLSLKWDTVYGWSLDEVQTFLGLNEDETVEEEREEGVTEVPLDL